MQVAEQLHTLESYDANFAAQAGGVPPLSLRTFQINVGKLCNMACTHCHVDASPKRTEIMTREIVELCLEAIAATPEAQVVDLTGGAPEMNPHFRYLVEECRRMGKHVIDRCNLTILEEPSYEWLADFLAEHEVEVVASLPHFAASRTDKQRGRGVFEKSITGLQKLNALGYADRLPLHLVYNPSGTFLAGSQEQLEREFKEKLSSGYGVRFNNLFCINNMPINRFLAALVRAGKYEDYMSTLVNAYNPATLEGLMCRHQISVSYDGQLYDCDFNQMLEMPATVGHIKDYTPETFLARDIKLANHCYGCTAGSGSSCGGELT